MSAGRRRLQSYDQRLRELVRETGDITIATELGVPRSTALGWLRHVPREVVSAELVGLNAQALRHEVLRRRVRVLAAVIRILLAVLRVSGFRLDRKRVSRSEHRRILLRTLDSAERVLPERAVLRILRISAARVSAWRHAEVGCDLDDRPGCRRTASNRMTAHEVVAMKEMATSLDYRHVPTGALALLAQRLGKVFASPTTWYRVARQRGWRRPRRRIHPEKPKVGLRATKPDAAWHVDDRLRPDSTLTVLLAAIRGATRPDERHDVISDGGVENFNGVVDALIQAGRLRRLLALTELRFSNSMIEAWWRQLKAQWPYLNSLDNVATLRRLVAFYVRAHNEQIPHSAFRGQTPDEMYFGEGCGMTATVTMRRAWRAYRAFARWERERVRPLAELRTVAALAATQPPFRAPRTSSDPTCRLLDTSPGVPAGKQLADFTRVRGPSLTRSRFSRPQVVRPLAMCGNEGMRGASAEWNVVRSLCLVCLLGWGCGGDPNPAADASGMGADAAAADATGVNPDAATPDASTPVADAEPADAESADAEPTTPMLEPLYPAHAGWNDYLSNDGGSISTASDAACPAQPVSFSSCLHGGEMRKIEVAGRSECGTLRATDSLGAFVWQCDESTAPVRMVSVALQPDHALIDLLDPVAVSWRDVTVEVRDDAGVLFTTPAAAWASDPVLALPAVSSTLDPDTIYVVATNVTGRFVLADGVGIAMASGVSVQCDGSSAEVLFGDAASRVWIEGDIDASGCPTAVSLQSSSNAALRRLEVHDATWPGSSLTAAVQLTSANASRFSQLTIRNSGFFGLFAEDSNGNLVEDFRSIHNGVQGQSIGRGMMFYGSRNVFRRGWEVATFGSGLHIEGDDNILVDWRVAGTGSLTSFTNTSMTVAEGARNVVAFVWLMHNEDTGLQFYRGDNNIAAGLFVGSTAREAVRIVNGTTTARNHLIMNVAAVNAANILATFFADDVSLIDLGGVALNSQAIWLHESNRFTFSGKLTAGTTSTPCVVSAGVEPGLIDATCTDDGTDGSSTYTGQRSDAVYSNDPNPSGTFALGPVVTDDTINTSDTDGTSAFDTLSDWTSFSGSERFWGRQVPLAGNFLDSAQSGRCDPGTTCQIIDWRLSSTDTGDDGSPVFLNTLAVPTGNDTFTHTWYATSPTECDAIAGATWNAIDTTCTTTFLRHAIEVFFDGIGNDNALCESGETCLYTPNLGTYQGHGPVSTVATISTGGAVENVTLLGHATNGY